MHPREETAAVVHGAPGGSGGVPRDRRGGGVAFAGYRSRERGFTLPEVLITILLLGIVGGIAAASWRGLIEDRRVETASRQFVSDLRLTHASATNQLVDWRVVYREDGGSVPCGGTQADYCLVRLSSVFPKTPTPTVVSTRPRDLPDRTRILGTNLGADDTTPAVAGADRPASRRVIEFNADGSAQSLDTTGEGYEATPQEPRPTVRIGASDGEPSRRVTFLRATSKIEYEG